MIIRSKKNRQRLTENVSFFTECERDNLGHCMAGTGERVDVGSDIRRAAIMLSRGAKIKLDQPDQVSTLIDEMAKLVETAVKQGDDAPKFDLCKVSVPGTNLFCQENIGVPRVRMPQMRGMPVPGSEADKLPKNRIGKVDVGEKFIQHLRDKGIKVEETKIRASHLRASQNEIDGTKIAQLVTEAKEGTRDLRERPIFVTRDNYVVDGHHHWAAIVGLGHSKGKDLKVPVYRLDTDIGTALDMANFYAKEVGIKPKSTPSSTSNSLIINPFVSEQQRRACYAKDDPAWDCHEWSQATPKGKKLPKYKKGSKASTNNRLRALISNLKRKGEETPKPSGSRNLLRIDPTRTASLRRALVAELRRRFALLKGAIYKLVVVEDAFGLGGPVINRLAANRHWSFYPTGELASNSLLEEIDQAASKAHPTPSREQQEAGNYRKGHVRVQGLEITIETAAGSLRKGKYKLAHHYGYIKRTKSASDGDHVDVFLGPNPESAVVFIVDQYKLNGDFDEHKCMVGFIDADSAKEAYHANYSANWKGFGGIRALTIDQFKSWVMEGDTSEPIVGQRLLVTNAEEQVFSVNAPGAYEFQSDPNKVRLFQEWLKTFIRHQKPSLSDEQLWAKYAQLGFHKGAARAFDDVRKPYAKGYAADKSTADFYSGSKHEFLTSAFSRPVAIEKVQLLAARSFNDMEGVTSAMATKMTRTLTDGMVQGKGPREVARDLNSDVEELGEARALTIARTEIVRAHAEGQLTAMEDLGVKEVGVAVEWSTTGDEKVCILCQPLEGIVLKIDEARGLLPRHPNCRCAWTPANVGEDDSEQKDTKREIQAALEESGLDVDISKDRPHSIFNEALLEFSNNVFCSTGVGGGVDSSCGRGAGTMSLTSRVTSIAKSTLVRSLSKEGLKTVDSLLMEQLINQQHPGAIAATKLAVAGAVKAWLMGRKMIVGNELIDNEDEVEKVLEVLRRLSEATEGAIKVPTREEVVEELSN